MVYMNCNKISNLSVCVWIQKHPKCAILSLSVTTILVTVGLIGSCTYGFIGVSPDVMGISLLTIIAFSLMTVACKNKKKKEKDKTKITTTMTPIIDSDNHQTKNDTRNSHSMSTATSVSHTTIPDDSCTTWEGWTLSFDPKFQCNQWINQHTNETRWIPPENSPWFTMKDEDGLPFYWNDWSKIFNIKYSRDYYYNNKTGNSQWEPPPGSPWATT